MAIKIDKAELAQRINSLEGLDNETKSQLLELLHERKRYGLVWEDKPEAAEERLQNELPILREVKERAIISDDPAAPNHILIEGDNLEALTTLSYTHEGKIDVIYIDPPYNTGNKDFVYNDSYVDTEDQFRHSKWLSFMAKRLKIAKRLLSDKGVIFISIDDNEQAQLKLLCDEVFGEGNFIANFKWNRVVKAPSLSNSVRTKYEYVLTYCKKERVKLFGKASYNTQAPLWHLPNKISELRFPSHSIKTVESFDAGFYGGSYNVELIDSLIVGEDGFNIEPVRIKANSAWGQSKIDEYIKEGNCFVIKKSPKTVYTYIDPANSYIAPSDLINDEECGVKRNTEANEDMKKIGIQFNYSKPISLISYLLNMLHIEIQNVTILDFFAGSGTTLHATMQLNAEDGGHRQCILVTNNENNICEEVTYERNKRVINGYTTPKGEQVEGLHANTLRYYKTDFVARESSATAKRELMYAATDMLCIKNNIYTEQPIFGSRKFRKDVCRYFADGERSMLVIYNPDAIEVIAEELQKLQIEQPILVYVFSLNDYAMDADFEDVSEKVSLCALPAAILNAYRKVLPKKQRKEESL